VNRPYAPTCSSDKNSTGMNQDRRPRATRPPKARKIVLTANGCSVVPQPRTRIAARFRHDYRVSHVTAEETLSPSHSVIV
jgi:hypothetical protein